MSEKCALTVRIAWAALTLRCEVFTLHQQCSSVSHSACVFLYFPLRLPWLVLRGGVQRVSVCTMPELRHLQGSHQCLRMCLHATVWRYVHGFIFRCQHTCHTFTVFNIQPRRWHVLVLCLRAGRHCEIYKDPCVKMRCQNGGRCESAGLNASCACPPGYLGEHWCHGQPDNQ